MPARRALLLAAAGTLALPAAAAAAPPWSPPVRVADEAVRTPSLAFGTLDTGVASVGFGAAATRLLSLRAGAAAPVATRDVGSIEDGPLPYGATRTLSLRRRPTNVQGRFLLGYAFGRTDGAVGTFRALRTVALRVGEAELAVSPAGHAVIAFVEERSGASRVWVSTRRSSSSRFTAPEVVRGSGSPRSLAVSVNDRGRFVVAYAYGNGRTRTVEARSGTTASGVGALQTVGTQLGRATVAAVVAPTGRTTVAWTTHDLGEEQNDPTQLRTNVAPAGRTTFAGQTVLDRASAGNLATEPAGPSLAAAPDGTTLVGYTLSGRFVGAGVVGDADTRYPARVSVQDRDARFTAPQELSPDAVVGRVAARADGTFAVPYVEGVPLEGGPSTLRVALGTTTFGTGEEVATDADATAVAAFEPGGAAGAPVVLYTLQRASGAAIARRAG